MVFSTKWGRPTPPRIYLGGYWAYCLNGAGSGNLEIQCGNAEQTVDSAANVGLELAIWCTASGWADESAVSSFVGMASLSFMPWEFLRFGFGLFGAPGLRSAYAAWPYPPKHGTCFKCLKCSLQRQVVFAFCPGIWLGIEWHNMAEKTVHISALNEGNAL